MKSILYIVPYFGKLPKLFPLWLQSCKYNSTINWLIFTDDETDYAYPSNVSVIYTTFDNVRTRIQRLYDFKITLESPYKLCDFKVAYGEVFADFINGYDFWGYCDVDLLFGNIRSFLTDKILESYDKIGWLGHSTLFKNCHQMNTLYRKELGGVRLYCIFFQSNKNHFFDEKWINLICKEQNISVFREVVFADLTPLTWNFQINHVTGEELLKNRHRLFVWNNGELSSISVLDGIIKEDSFMYVHFLRRRMKIGINKQETEYLIVPNRIISMPNILDVDTIRAFSKNNMLMYWIELIIAKRHKMTIKNIVHYFIERYKVTRKR